MEEIKLQSMSEQELLDTDGGIIVALVIICFAAGVAIGLGIV